MTLSDRPQKLLDAERDAALAAMPGWAYDCTHSAIKRRFKFADFAEAWDFMSKVAQLAEKMDHHPDWNNVYDTVDVTLSTHDVGGVTSYDIIMAEAINKFSGPNQ